MSFASVTLAKGDHAQTVDSPARVIELQYNGWKVVDQGEGEVSAHVALVTGLEESAGYDPSAHTAEEVNAYLEGVDESERDAVLARERAGKSRKSIVG